MTAEYGPFEDADAELMPGDETSCVWAVNPVVSTVFASSAFARLVGIDRRVLAGQPWFVVLPITSIAAAEWLVHTAARRPSATLDVRHLEGEYISVVLSRVCGGPGHDHAVFRVSPLGQRGTPAVITAIPTSAPADVDPAAANQARHLGLRGATVTRPANSGPRGRRGWTRRSHAGH